MITALKITIRALATKDDVDYLRKAMSEIKADIIRWMLMFWIGQAGATLGLLSLFIKR